MDFFVGTLDLKDLFAYPYKIKFAEISLSSNSDQGEDISFSVQSPPLWVVFGPKDIY